MSNRLAGKVCIITGTGGSMGRAAALTRVPLARPHLISCGARPALGRDRGLRSVEISD
jgi:hypothetical protein